MLREMCKSKIHRLTVTDGNIHYEGSITIDETLLKAADMLPYEKVHVVNITNGNRLVTYTIPGQPGNGDVCLNGAAALLCNKGDIIIVISYAAYNEQELKNYKPKIVKVDSKNRVIV
ncbi:MAG: aspartate 1-decarboxylase [Candidatus Margulisiibacteriota bacterium]|jgi:aspartate 1-decarboxylase